MTERFLLGLALAIVAFAPLVWGTVLLRRRFLPDRHPAIAALLDVTGVLSTVLVLSELVGALGEFRLTVVTPVFALSGVALGGIAGRSHRVRARQHREPPDSPRTAFPPTSERRLRLIALLLAGIVAADWMPRVVQAYSQGMLSADTIWYHMPFAAGFVQQASFWHLHYVDADAVTVFFPANSEVVHALGILFLGSDVVSPALNIGWLGLALTAGWGFAARSGVGWGGVAVVAALFSTPGLVATQPGGAYDDVASLAMLLVAATLVLSSESADSVEGAWGYGAAGLAAGFAVGTKLTLLIPVAALTVGAVVLARRPLRARRALAWTIGMASTGSFWYLRNLVQVGNPLPNLHLHLGPFSLPSPRSETQPSTLAQFLFNTSDWHAYFLPGLRLSFGPFWWLLVGLSLLGMALAVVLQCRPTRVIGLVAVVSAIGFLLSPQYLAILGLPVFFTYNVRYVDPAVLLGLVLVLTLPAIVRAPRRLWGSVAAAAAVVLANQLDASIWPIHVFSAAFAMAPSASNAVIGVAVVLALAGIVMVGKTARSLPVRGGARSVVLVSVMASVVVIANAGNHMYLENRYRSATIRPEALRQIFARAQQVEHGRVGVAGESAQLQYPFYGAHLDNVVQYIGMPAPAKGYQPVRTCAQWVSAVDAGAYQYLYLSAGPASSAKALGLHRYSYMAWTSLDPAARLLNTLVDRVSLTPGSWTYTRVALFELTGPLHSSTCSLPAAKDALRTVA